jgi:hypothetical protein
MTETGNEQALWQIGLMTEKRICSSSKSKFLLSCCIALAIVTRMFGVSVMRIYLYGQL